jgi:hypothetical protein
VRRGTIAADLLRVRWPSLWSRSMAKWSWSSCCRWAVRSPAVAPAVSRVSRSDEAVVLVVVGADVTDADEVPLVEYRPQFIHLTVVKPDLHHSGGRALYVRPVAALGEDTVELRLASASATARGTGSLHPAEAGRRTPRRSLRHEQRHRTRHAKGQSPVRPARSRSGGPADFPFPDPLLHPILAKALLVHASSWGTMESQLREALRLDPNAHAGNSPRS